MPKGDSHLFQPVLVIKDLQIEAPGLPQVRNVNLSLEPGRILGIAGVREAGLETLELAIAGFLRRPDNKLRHGACKFEGSITLNGRETAGKGVRAFREAGGAYLGADRLGSNLAPELPLRDSLIIHAFRRARPGSPQGLPPPKRLSSMLGKLGFLDTAWLESWCRKIMNRAGIARSVSDRASSFSGGMIQRILLSRELAEAASLVVLSEAGGGLDQANRARLAEELRELVRHGAAVLLFSSDAQELSDLAGEIAVLSNGTLAAGSSGDAQ